jgi:hypothetical protein
MSPSEWIRKVLREAAEKAKLEHALGLGPKMPDGTYRTTNPDRK